jgi:hypothetical protein
MNAMSDVEMWGAIPGFDGYEASTFGRVRSWLRTVRRTQSRRKSKAPAEARILSPGSSHGYPMVVLMKDGKKFYRLVHQLVLETFVGPCPPGMEGCHFPDRSPANCRLHNLRWDTKSENMEDQRAHGTLAAGVRNGRHGNPRRTLRGTQNGRALLREGDVRVIRMILSLPDDERPRQDDIGAAFRISQPAVDAINRRITWKHVA